MIPCIRWYFENQKIWFLFSALLLTHCVTLHKPLNFLEHSFFSQIFSLLEIQETRVVSFCLCIRGLGIVQWDIWITGVLMYCNWDTKNSAFAKGKSKLLPLAPRAKIEIQLRLSVKCSMLVLIYCSKSSELDTQIKSFGLNLIL